MVCALRVDLAPLPLADSQSSVFLLMYSCRKRAADSVMVPRALFSSLTCFWFYISSNSATSSSSANSSLTRSCWANSANLPLSHTIMPSPVISRIELTAA